MTLLKQWVSLLVLSFLIIFFKQELLWVLHGISFCYQHIAAGINHIFPKGPWIKLCILAIVLLVCTVAIAAIFGGIGCVFKKKFSKWFVPAAWISWLVIGVTVILQGT